MANNNRKPPKDKIFSSEKKKNKNTNTTYKLFSENYQTERVVEIDDSNAYSMGEQKIKNRLKTSVQIRKNI